MGDAKNIELKPINSSDAKRFMVKNHYSKKVKGNSQLHIGVFWENKLEGVMSFGPPIDRSKMLPMVEGTKWGQMMELNRMAFTDKLPRNSESRALGIAFRLFKKYAPHVKWVVSFSDATQCGDGTIYRASGFILTMIKDSEVLARLPSGEVMHLMTPSSNPTMPRPELGGRSFYDVTGGRYNWPAYCRAANAEPLVGHQLRYIKFIDETWRDRLTVPVIPFEDIDKYGAGMYRGESIPRSERHVGR